MNDIKQELEALIAQRFKNPRQFAKEAGIPYTTVMSIIERDDIGQTTTNTLFKFANTLRIDVGALRDGQIVDRPHVLEAQTLDTLMLKDIERVIVLRYRDSDAATQKMIEKMLDISNEV
jgi:hypothetical protein